MGHEFRHQDHYLEFMRHFIVEAIRKMGRARPRDLERCFHQAFGQRITDDTFRRYADLLVEEGILRREVLAGNSGKAAPGRRRYCMVWYLLK
jgi:hypothetical protein